LVAEGGAPTGLLPWLLPIACALVFALAWAVTGLALPLLERLGLHDHPNRRSSHSKVKPRGGGLAILAVLLPGWLGWALWSGAVPLGFWPVLGGLLLLALVSLVDDLRSLSSGLRFACQILAVAIGLWGLQPAGPVFQGLLPPLLDSLAAGFAWLWFINLFNFMDGIDGMTGTETVALGAGLALAAWLAALDPSLVVLPALLAAAAGGFLLWNWEPSRLFIGDVGSVPLGFLLGWLLLLLAAEGEWAAALILPLYYLADASFTLLRRALRGAAVWRAHREHAYQRAALALGNHAAVTRQIALLDTVLVGLALVAVSGYPWIALGAAFVSLACLLLALERQARSASRLL